MRALHRVEKLQLYFQQALHNVKYQRQDTMSDEADSGGSESLEESPREELSEIQVTLGEHSKFIADNFDTLYDEVELLKGNLEATEIKLREEMDAKMLALKKILTARIEMLEGRTEEQSVKIEELQRLSKQQGKQLEDLQNQVGVLFFRYH